MDDRHVDIVVLLISPVASGGRALGTLSCIARRFRDEGVLAAVRAARDTDEVYAALVS